MYDARANENVHDSNRLRNQIPENPSRHLKQQRKHHSTRPSHPATQHARKQTTQQTTQQTRRPRSKHVPDGFCRENHVKRLSSKFAHPHHSVYFYFTGCRVHTGSFPCAVLCLFFAYDTSKCRLRMSLISRHTPACLSDVWSVQGQS